MNSCRLNICMKQKQLALRLHAQYLHFFYSFSHSVDIYKEMDFKKRIYTCVSVFLNKNIYMI